MADVPAIADLSIAALVEWGQRSLCEAASFDDVRKVRAKAEALAAYQKSIGAAQEAIEAVTEIRWRAERRMGEELDYLPSAQGRRSDPVHDGNEVEGPPTNAELGLSRHEVAG